MKYLVIVLLLLAGCSSMNYAGTASYNIKPFIDANGNKHCCEVNVRNGKEIGELDATITAKADGSYKVRLHEVSVKAFEGQRIAGKAAAAGLGTISKVVAP